jgi:hypothetical protein
MRIYVVGGSPYITSVLIISVLSLYQYAYLHLRPHHTVDPTKRGLHQIQTHSLPSPDTYTGTSLLAFTIEHKQMEKLPVLKSHYSRATRCPETSQYSAERF